MKENKLCAMETLLTTGDTTIHISIRQVALLA